MMLKIFSSLLLILIALAGASPAQSLKESITLVSREKATGNKRWESKVVGQYLIYQGKTYIYFIEEGKDSKEGGHSWRSSAYSYVNNSNEVSPYSVDVVIKNEKGEVTDRISKFYDINEGRVICQVNRKDKEFPYQQNMFDKQNMGIILMNFPFGSKKEMSGHLVTHDPAIYAVKIVYRGQETIGNTPCYKLEMIFDMGILNLFYAFVPKFYFWCEVAPPHRFVRYEGLESGLGTPYVVIEGKRD